MGRREKVRYNTGFKSDNSVRWADMWRESIPSITRKYTKSSRCKERFSKGRNSKKVTISRSRTSRWRIGLLDLLNSTAVLFGVHSIFTELPAHKNMQPRHMTDWLTILFFEVKVKNYCRGEHFWTSQVSTIMVCHFSPRSVMRKSSL